MDPIPLHHVWTYTDVDRAFWREHLEPWLPQRIFDAHTHVSEPRFPPRGHERGEAAAILGQRGHGADRRGRCRAMPESGVSRARVLLPLLRIGSLDFDIDGENADSANGVRAARLVSAGRGAAAVVGRPHRARTAISLACWA